MSNFPLVELSGTPRSIGLQHGEQLSDRIVKTIEFYRTVFDQDEDTILTQALKYKSVIAKFNSRYIEEIEGIAEGAGVDNRWILAVNARSEILTMFSNECTALYSSGGLLAQNWDWAEQLEELAVIMKIRDDEGREILMMTEPGIIGKIGLNSAGIGVCLNFLPAQGKLDGVPIHVVLRSILDAQSLPQARNLALDYAGGQSGNILISDGESYCNIEFANSTYYEYTGANNFVHTNHYLRDEELNSQIETIENSRTRLDRATELIDQDNSTVEALLDILSNQEDNEYPICRPYILDEQIGNIGTICTLIMDLPNLALHYTPGNPQYNKLQSVRL